MDLELEGKTAIVTGASRGIAKAVARELELAARELSQETGRKVVGITADTTSTPEVDHMVQEAAKELGRIDIQVNNAAAPGNCPGTIGQHFR